MKDPQAAAYLKVSVSTLYHWTHEGKIPHSTAGSKKLVFSKSGLDAFIRSRKRSTNEDIERDTDRKVGVLRSRRGKKLGG
ncbi:MAG: DNA-binding protein [Nitrospiraceae bacterium]|nr:MAG: DNA-binding protein [Nitrospiraceae bacterium]